MSFAHRVVAVGILALAGGQAGAEPAIAVRTGYPCSQCHVNRTGGGMRTPFGSLYTQTVMPQRLLRWREGGNLLPADPDARLAAGGDARFQYLYGHVEEGDDVSSFEVPEANLYGEARLVPGRLSLYLDETVGPGGASAREVFGLVSFSAGWQGYVKAGRFLPAFGWRLPDDDAFVRQFSGFTYSAPDTGVELGLEPGKWSLAFAALNGASGTSDDDREKRFVLQVARRFRGWRLGLSATNEIEAGVTSRGGGLHGGIAFGRLALLGEADWFEVDDDQVAVERLLGLFEADLLVARGVLLKYAHDWIDPDRDVDTDERVRDSLGLEYVPIPFVQLRLFVRRRDGPPQVVGARDDQVDLELHLFF